MSLAVFRSKRRPDTPVEAGIPISDLELDLDRKEHREQFAAQAWGRYEASYEESCHLRAEEWRANYLFAFEGKQWLYYNEALEEFLPVENPTENLKTQNLMIGAVAHAAASLVAGRPAIQVFPLNSDYHSKCSARAGQALYLFWERQLRLGRARYLTALDALTCGFGVTRAGWNATAGKVVEIPSGRVRKDGTPVTRSREFEGRPDVQVVSPWCFFPQVGLTLPSLQDADYTSEILWLSKRNLEMLADDWKGDLDLSMREGEDHKAWGPNNEFGERQMSEVKAGKFMCLLYTQRPQPVKGYEKGLQTLIVGNSVVSAAPLDDPEGRLPYQMFPWIPRRDSFYCREWLTDLREPQRNVNGALSHQLMYAAICAAPNLAVWMNSGLPDDLSIGFQKWEIPPGVQIPQWVGAPQAPPELFRIKADNEQSFQMVGRQFPTSIGQHQANMPSNTYAETLREAENVGRMPIAMMHAEAFEDQAYHLLLLEQLYGRQDRTIAIVGENGATEAFSFHGDHLQVDLFRIVCHELSLLNFSPAAKQARLMELYDRGWFQNLDERGRGQLFEYMKLPQLSEIQDAKWLERSLAKRNHHHLIYEKRPVAVDARWPVVYLLEEATARLMEDDAEHWPEDVRKVFDGYFAQLSQAAELQRTKALEAQKQAQSLAIEGEAAVAEARSMAKAKSTLAVEGGKAMMKAAEEAEGETSDPEPKPGAGPGPARSGRGA